MMGSTGGQRNRIVWLLSAFHGRPFIDETYSIAFLDASCKLGAFVFQSGHPDKVIWNVGGFASRRCLLKHFQTIHHCSVDVARGLVLLFGIGTKALVWGVFSQEV